MITDLLSKKLTKENLVFFLEETSDGVCFDQGIESKHVQVTKKLSTLLNCTQKKPIVQELERHLFFSFFLEENNLASFFQSKSVSEIIVTLKQDKNLTFKIKSASLPGEESDFFVYLFTKYSSSAKEDQEQQKLKTSNNDLEKFAYIVSHDLQAPIRRITSYSEIVRETLDETRGEDNIASKYLKKIEDICQESSDMIFSLLNLCKINSQDFTKKEIKIDDLFKTALLPFEGLIERQELFLTISQATEQNVFANLHHIRDVVFNIISNSVKFKKENSPATVTLSASSLSESMVLFEIKDQGIGIENSSKVFDFYNREATSIKGHGVGLGTCKRIIEANQGKIWCESILGQGTKFSFSLPAIKNEGAIGINRLSQKIT